MIIKPWNSRTQSCLCEWISNGLWIAYKIFQVSVVAVLFQFGTEFKEVKLIHRINRKENIKTIQILFYSNHNAWWEPWMSLISGTQNALQPALLMSPLLRFTGWLLMSVCLNKIQFQSLLIGATFKQWWRKYWISVLK